MSPLLRRVHLEAGRATRSTGGFGGRECRVPQVGVEAPAIHTCMGLFLSSHVFGLLAVLCSKRESRSSSRRRRSGSRSARKGSRDRNASRGLAACRLAGLVFGSALTPEHAQGR